MSEQKPTLDKIAFPSYARLSLMLPCNVQVSFIEQLPLRALLTVQAIHPCIAWSCILREDSLWLLDLQPHDLQLAYKQVSEFDPKRLLGRDVNAGHADDEFIHAESHWVSDALNLFRETELFLVEFVLRKGGVAVVGVTETWNEDNCASWDSLNKFLYM